MVVTFFMIIRRIGVINQKILIMKTQIIASDSVSEFYLYSGLLRSNYKSIVAKTYKNKSTSKSLFGIRQHIKSSQFFINDAITFSLRILIFIFLITLILV